jgi:hypothetical protein
VAADPGYRGPAVPCGEGHQARFVAWRAKTIATVLGAVRIRRAWYHCAQCRCRLAPLDAWLQVARCNMTPGLRKMIARAAAAVPFAAAARLIGELAGIRLTGKRAGRRAEADGQAAAQVIEARAAAVAARHVVPIPPSAGQLPDKLYVCIDGTGVQMVAAETAGRDAKDEDARLHTREVKMAVAFTQTRLGDEGRPVRDPASSSYVATFAPAPEFGVLMAAEARRRGAGQIRQMVIIGDGAAWIWNLAARHFPEATQIVDLYHAREHLHDLANLAARLLAGHRDDWLAARLEELDAGDVQAILAAGRDLNFTGALAGERDKALAYFEHNAHRMRYQHYRDLGMFAGSGVVEAGVQADRQAAPETVRQRWTLNGAYGILALRCLEASHRWDEIWNQPCQAGAA